MAWIGCKNRILIFFVPFYAIAAAVSFSGMGVQAADSDPAREVNHIVYLMQAGSIAPALNLYREYCKHIGHHDNEVLEKIGLILLDQGFRSKDPEHQLLTLYGAGISLNEKSLYILEDGIRSPDPRLQLVAMSFLSRCQDDNADAILNRALSSDSLIIRLEGAYLLAQRGVKTALGQTESLMCKLDKSLWPIFPQIYAKIGTPGAIRILKKMLTNTDERVRIAAVLSIAENRRDDLLPNIRMLASHHNQLQQEACAKALGILKDESSITKLQSLALSSAFNLRLAALGSLYALGRTDARCGIEKEAREKNIFAISMLGDISGSEVVLAELMNDSDVQVRVNAAIALVKRRDPRCLPTLYEILVRSPRDLAFSVIPSPGMALEAYRVVPSARQNLAENAQAAEMSLSIREQILSMCRQLPEKDFFCIAQTLFEYQQNDLIPTLVGLLENLQTAGAIDLLKKYQQKAGAPLVRAYCAVALYRLKEPGPYKEALIAWITKHQQEDLIHLRPIIPWQGSKSYYKIAPQDASRLLVEAFEALTDGQEDEGIHVLLDAIQYGNPKNKYALAGLLIRIS